MQTEEEAKELIERCCEPVYVTSEQRFAYAAQELVEEQTLKNLYAFGDRLETEYQKMLTDKQIKELEKSIKEEK